MSPRPKLVGWDDSRYWATSVDADHEELGAVLRRALVVDAVVVTDAEADGGGVTGILLELHHEGTDENYMLRLAATGFHTEGWIVASVRKPDALDEVD